MGARIRNHLNTAGKYFVDIRVRKCSGGEDDGEYCNKIEVVISENEKMFVLNSDFFQVLKLDNENSFRL